MTDAVVVLVTGPDAEALEALCRTLVEEGRIACANILPGVRSLFRWEGEVARETEALAILKTSGERTGALQRRVLELHPYDIPEFLVLPVREGSEEYLAWLRSSLGAD